MGKNAFVIEGSKTAFAQEDIVVRLQELGLRPEDAKLIVEYTVLSCQDITAIMSDNAVLAPEDKRKSIAYNALHEAQNMAQYDKLKHNISAFLSQFSEDELFCLSQRQDIIAQAQEYEWTTLYGRIVSRKDAQSMAIYKELRSKKGQMELEQRFSGQSLYEQKLHEQKLHEQSTAHHKAKKQHKAVSIKEAAQILACSDATIKRYDKGEGELAEYYPGRDSVTALRQFAARRHSRKAMQRTAKEMRNARTGYDLDEL